MDVSPLLKWGLSLPPETAIPKPWFEFACKKGTEKSLKAFNVNWCSILFQVITNYCMSVDIKLRTLVREINRDREIAVKTVCW